MRAQRAECCGDAGIIILARTHCFGQTKITDRNTVIVLCDSFVTVLCLSAINPKGNYLPSCNEDQMGGEKKKRKYTACEHTPSGSFARVKLVRDL